MRSTETVSKPEACAVSTAACACRALWRRPRKRRAASEKDCTPRERVRTPRSRQAVQASAVTSSGLASRKIQGRRERQVRAARAQHAREVLCRQQGGRSSTEVHGVEGPGISPLVRGKRHLGHQVLDEALPRRSARLQDREVTVRADGRAERDVEVEPGSPGLDRPRRPGAEPQLRSRAARSHPARSAAAWYVLVRNASSGSSGVSSDRMASYGRMNSENSVL